jgi:biopolymer transport protein ExbB/TolQ
MEILMILQDIFYTIMIGLLLPVMMTLLVSLAVVLYIFGGFLHEILSRKKKAGDVDSFVVSIFTDVADGDCPAVADKIKQHLLSCLNETRQVRCFLAALAGELEKGSENIEMKIERVLMENETRTAKALDVTKAFVRLGPMVGLMGTLIPIGGALLSLSLGDMTKMSNQLIIAFSTTVVGLFVAGLSYVISIVRERWYESDMKTMEYLSEILVENLCPSEKAARK